MRGLRSRTLPPSPDHVPVILGGGGGLRLGDKWSVGSGLCGNMLSGVELLVWAEGWIGVRHFCCKYANRYQCKCRVNPRRIPCPTSAEWEGAGCSARDKQYSR